MWKDIAKFLSFLCITFYPYSQLADSVHRWWARLTFYERTVCIQLKNNEFWMHTIYLNYSHTTKKADILNFWWYLFSSDMANNFNIKDVAYMTFYAQSHMFISFEEWIARDDFMCLKFVLHDNLKINIFTSFPSFSFQLWNEAPPWKVGL